MQDELSDKILEIAVKQVFLHTGISMNSSKKSLLQSRLMRRMKALGIMSYPEYFDYLASNKNEIQEFVNAVTTNETYFFRTDRVWSFFIEEFLPRWFVKNKGRPLKIWSAASSTGEEAYSMAMSCEEFKKKVQGFSYQIIGTDISSDVLNKAKNAAYGGRSIERIKKSHPELFSRYFGNQGEEFVIDPILKKQVTFQSHNLLKVFSVSSFDIIFLRNVLIYFKEEEQEKVLSNMERALLPGGHLIIGESESLSRLNTKFKATQPLIYTNKDDTNDK